MRAVQAKAIHYNFKIPSVSGDKQQAADFWKYKPKQLFRSEESIWIMIECSEGVRNAHSTTTQQSTQTSNSGSNTKQMILVWSNKQTSLFDLIKKTANQINFWAVWIFFFGKYFTKRIYYIYFENQIKHKDDYQRCLLPSHSSTSTSWTNSVKVDRSNFAWIRLQCAQQHVELTFAEISFAVKEAKTLTQQTTGPIRDRRNKSRQCWLLLSKNNNSCAKTNLHCQFTLVLRAGRKIFRRFERSTSAQLSSRSSSSSSSKAQGDCSIWTSRNQRIATNLAVWFF